MKALGKNEYENYVLIDLYKEKEYHKEIVKQYEHDFTKHNDNIPSARILQVFRSIIPQLAKENNEKFMYTAITGSARARDFEESIEWLVTIGIAHRTVKLFLTSVVVSE